MTGSPPPAAGEPSSRLPGPLRKLLAPHNWRTLRGLLLHCTTPIAAFARHYLRTGTYPWTVRVRTPIGTIGLELHSRQDLITVSEIFFREDYRSGTDIRTAMDFGANIGVASAYFLTRNDRVVVRAFEPVPTNIERATRNLAQFGRRIDIVRKAVSDRDGVVTFGVEPSGRYGGIGVQTKQSIQVECTAADAEAARFVAEFGPIDVMKVDIEGHEQLVIGSLKPETLRSVRTIFAEADLSRASPPGYEFSQYLSISILARRAESRAT